VAELVAGKAAVVQINTEENKALAGKFGVRGIPVIMLLINGRIVDQLAGAQPVDAIVDWFKRKQ
jgi:thioredoxin-like negative regulator of GroEL